MQFSPLKFTNAVYFSVSFPILCRYIDAHTLIRIAILALSGQSYAYSVRWNGLKSFGSWLTIMQTFLSMPQWQSELRIFQWLWVANERIQVYVIFATRRETDNRMICLRRIVYMDTFYLVWVNVDSTSVHTLRLQPDSITIITIDCEPCDTLTRTSWPIRLDILTVRVLALYDKGMVLLFFCSESFTHRRVEKRVSVVLYALLVLESIAKFSFMIYNNMAQDGKDVHSL